MDFSKVINRLTSMEMQAALWLFIRPGPPCNGQRLPFIGCPEILITLCEN